MDKLEYSFAEMMHEIVNSMKGSHKLKAEAWIADSYNKPFEMIATGEITIKEKPIGKNHPAFSFDEPSAAFKDPVTEKKMIEAFNQNWKDKKMTAIKAYPQTKDWAVFYNEITGAPMRKGINAILLIKDEKGCRYVCAAFSKDHEGGGKYGSIYYFGYCYDGLPAGGRYINCQ